MSKWPVDKSARQRYLATLIGTTDDVTMRWFILAVALLLDPAAVLLLLAATRLNVSRNRTIVVGE